MERGLIKLHQQDDGSALMQYVEPEHPEIIALFGANPEFKMRAIANRHVAQPGGTFDQHANTNSAFSHYLHIGADNGVIADLDLGTDIRSRRIEERHPGVH